MAETSSPTQTVEVTRLGVILDETDLYFENEGVFNPASVQNEDGIHLYYRAVSDGNYSTVGYARLSDPTTVAERWDHPIYTPRHLTEKHGVEDPRVAVIDGTYYMTYTAFDGFNALGALATSTDGFHFQRQGIITPDISLLDMEEHLQEAGNDIHPKYFTHIEMLHKREPIPDQVLVWDKDVVYFPRKINGKFVYMHRIWPGIQVVQYEQLEDLTPAFWKDYFHHFPDHIMMDPTFPFESSHIGGGCVPIETPEGWLIIYHGVEKKKYGNIYHAAAALVDLENPAHVIGRLSEPFFSPNHEYEQVGYVNNVVFPTGTAQEGDTLYMYYGASDSKIAVASCSLEALVKALKVS